MRVYLAGPMSGITQHNFPAFDAAARDLRARGYDVVSPAELDDPVARQRSLQSQDGAMSPLLWAECLARDVKLIAGDGIQAVVVLPDWRRSRGARLETFVARLDGLPVYHYGPRDPLRRVARSHLELVHSLKEAP